MTVAIFSRLGIQARGAGTWHVTSTDKSSWISSLSCPTTTLCVAARRHRPRARVDRSGRTSTHFMARLACRLRPDDLGGVLPLGRALRGGGWRRWCAVDNQSCRGRGGVAPGIGRPGPVIWSVSCPDDGFCVAADEAGRILSSRAPASGGRWHVTALGVSGIGAVSCPARQLCVAGDGDGDLLTSHAQAGRAAGWRSVAADPGHWIAGISCPSTARCVATNNVGRVCVTQNPSAGTSTWSASAIDTGAVIWSVSCANDCGCISPATVTARSWQARSHALRLTSGSPEAAGPAAARPLR